jgi:hypothetical protein
VAIRKSSSNIKLLAIQNILPEVQNYCDGKDQSDGRDDILMADITVWWPETFLVDDGQTDGRDDIFTRGFCLMAE